MPSPTPPRAADSPLARRWRELHEGATVVEPPAGRYVVVAPHPDDEVLTVGGLINRLVAVGADVTVVAVTDGGSAYPDRIEHDELASTRRREQAASLHRLGVPADRVIPLGIRDGQVAEHEEELAERISELCTPATTLVAPWSHDVHTDHEAVGRATARAAAGSGCTSWSSLFWAWHSAEPATLDGVDLIAVLLDDDMGVAKAEALRCHVSQLEPGGIDPILDVGALEPSTWPAEYFVVGAQPAVRT